MAIFESTLLNLVNGNSTSSLLSGNALPATTTLGGTTSLAAATCVRKDENGDLKLNPKGVATTSTTTAITTTALVMQSQTGLPEEYYEEASSYNWTATETAEVNNIRDMEEFFASLTEEEQDALLASIDQRTQELTASIDIEKPLVKKL